jgi:hypothetical protein
MVLSPRVGESIKLVKLLRRMRWRSELPQGEWRGVFQPRALSEPYVNLSIHTAPIIQPPLHRLPSG